MKHSISKFLWLLFLSMLYWVCSFLQFAIVRYNGLDREFSVFFDETFDIPTDLWVRFGIYLGLVIGVFYAIIDFFFDKHLFRNLILGVRIVLKTIVYFILMVSVLSVFVLIAENETDMQIHHEMGWWMTNKIFWTILLYYTLASLVFTFIKIANEKFGRGVFLNLLIGKYKKPREEKRIFMFLDLQSSTTIAENLGHFKYSELIQDCFYDLNRIINKYNAEIFQYVGDEAVLTWTYKNGIKNKNCINIFFAFERRLRKKEKLYQSKYNLSPKFKAGIHGGKLIVTEVGTVKKEIAYHGDVINTTARIQGECNKYNESVLTSEALLQDLNLDATFINKSLGSIALKGKQEDVNIFSLNKA